MDVLSLGEYHAINLGINYKKLVKKQFIIISILVSVSTALVGPVTFLGILLTSLAREVTKGYRHNYLVISAFLISVLSLVYSLFIVERILNFETTMQFLQSITFADAKRTFTKEVLMRIDLLELAQTIDKSELQNQLNYINSTYNFNLNLDLWCDFINEMKPIESGQMELFA